jgi:hypothetical protein
MTQPWTPSIGNVTQQVGAARMEPQTNEYHDAISHPFSGDLLLRMEPLVQPARQPLYQGQENHETPLLHPPVGFAPNRRAAIKAIRQSAATAYRILRDREYLTGIHYSWIGEWNRFSYEIGSKEYMHSKLPAIRKHCESRDWRCAHRLVFFEDSKKTSWVTCQLIIVGLINGKSLPAIYDERLFTLLEAIVLYAPEPTEENYFYTVDTNTHTYIDCIRLVDILQWGTYKVPNPYEDHYENPR